MTIPKSHLNHSGSMLATRGLFFNLETAVEAVEKTPKVLKMPTKAELRRHAIQQRNTLSNTQRTTASDAICQQICRSDFFTSATTIALYHATMREVDLTAVMHTAWQQHKIVCSPRITSSHPPQMEFFTLDANTPLTPNQFDIVEPVAPPAVCISASAINIMLLPLLAFDDHGHRLGMGAGFYDSYINKAASNRPLLVGVAFDIQHVESIPQNTWDCTLDIVITESAVIRFSN